MVKARVAMLKIERDRILNIAKCSKIGQSQYLESQPLNSSYKFQDKKEVFINPNDLEIQSHSQTFDHNSLENYENTPQIDRLNNQTQQFNNNQSIFTDAMQSAARET